MLENSSSVDYLRPQALVPTAGESGRLANMACRVTPAYDTSMATADLPIWAPTPEKMQAAIERLVAAAQPTRIILFGSRARGDADDRSDVDLLVIKPRVENRYEELVELDSSLAGILMPVDILLVSEAEFEERAEQPGTVERAARKEGRMLYADAAQRTLYR
jgi:predicted nucleotidyltransferase